MFTFIQTVLKYRKVARLYSFDPVEVVADDSMYAFSRGDAFIALTNVGGGSSSIKKTLSGSGVQYLAGTVVCNIFSPSTDCIKIQENYTIDIYLNDGECKLFLPKKYFM
jgi:alpha-amylase